jgi:predicted branched-subunit amino acid permease
VAAVAVTGEAGEAVQRRRAIRDALSVGLAVGTYGVAFGAASIAAGLSVLQTALLSMLAFTGGTQFAVVGVLAGGGAGLSAVSSGMLLGARNTLYSVRLRPLLGVHGPKRWLAAHGTIDESTAMAVAQPTAALSRLAFWWTASSVWVGWTRRPCSVRSGPTRWATRPGSGSMRSFPPRSSPCWHPGCGPAL